MAREIDGQTARRSLVSTMKSEPGFATCDVSRRVQEAQHSLSCAQIQQVGDTAEFTARLSRLATASRKLQQTF